MEVYEVEKRRLLEHITLLREKTIPLIPNTIQVKFIEQLYKDIKNDSYTVVVLGEFKRGKSTFVNALLGEDILPVDITPTTATINKIVWGDSRKLWVYKKDNSVEEMELNKENLDRYIANSGFDLDNIKHLEIALPLDILKNNVVLVDTPGVDDINDQRVEVTYDFIPGADAIIFLLDLTSPIRRTEKEFIEENLLENYIDKILFVANFMDRLDEEELEEIILEVHKRLRAALGGAEAAMLPVSSRQALDGKVEGDEELLEESNMLVIEEKVKEFIGNGLQSENKMKNYKLRLSRILDSLEKDLRSKINLHDADIDELNKNLDAIVTMILKKEVRKTAIEDYILKQKTEISSMIKKSIHYFGDQLREDTMFEVENFNGLEFKDFVEKRIPMIIKKRVKQWVDQNSLPVEKMFNMLERELAFGLSRYFNTQVSKFNTTAPNCLSVDSIKTFSIDVQDISGTNIEAGLLAAGAGVAAIILGGPILMPIVGMAGFPFIQKKMLKEKLKEAKEQTIPELNMLLNKILSNIEDSFDEMIEVRIKRIEYNTEVTFDELLKGFENTLNSEILERRSEKGSIEKEKNILLEEVNRVKSINNSLKISSIGGV